uniref:Uncharacterized protein n=1 Tax=Poecilia latipinna TaxID=48699 RepID=A0A3B3U062_9TELE
CEHACESLGSLLVKILDSGPSRFICFNLHHLSHPRSSLDSPFPSHSSCLQPSHVLEYQGFIVLFSLSSAGQQGFLTMSQTPSVALSSGVKPLTFECFEL